MSFTAFAPSPTAVSGTAFDRLEDLASDATVAELKIVQGDQMTVTARGALKVEEAAYSWTVNPPPRRNLVVTLLRLGAAVDAETGETIDRVVRKQLPMDCTLVIPRPINSERMRVDSSDRRKLMLAWPNSSPLDNHDWGASR